MGTRRPDLQTDKHRLQRGEYEWTDSGCVTRNDGPTIIYLLLKIINPDTRIGVYNLKYEIEKANLDKFGNNVKDIIDETYENYSIIIDKG